MVKNDPTPESLQAFISRLEGRIAALENILERRSRELRLLQRALCPADLVRLARITEGLSPLPQLAHQLEYWNETTELVSADLESTLEDLWDSLTPSPASAALRNSEGTKGEARLPIPGWPEVPHGSPE